MNLYLVRHGAAVNVGEQGVKADAERMLSPEGVQKTREVVRCLKLLATDVDRIISSPLLRATQTAEIIARALGKRKALETSEVLRPDTALRVVLAWLRRHCSTSTLLVGHMPALAELTSRLIADNTRARIEFKKAGVAKISFMESPEPGQGQLEWLLPPRVAATLVRLKNR